MKNYNNKILRLITSCFILICSLFIFSCKSSCKDDENTEINKTSYYVTFDYNNGTSSSMVKVEENKKVEKPTTDPVKDGYTFLYWSIDNKEFDFNTPITSHITLIAEYVSNEVKTTRVRWIEDEAITYVYEEEAPRVVEVGSTVKFKINESPYYEGDLKVYVNELEIKKNENDEYSFVAESETTYEVSTEGLTKEDSKILGSGTSDNPYVISNEAQFKTFVEGVNKDSDSRYNASYFVLESDLNFNGYLIETIGTTLNVNQFSGHFDGKNHTISNFKLEEKNGIFGLFGYLVTGTISNLFIETDLSSTTSNDSYNLIGSLVAYNIGSDIINCGYSGTINVENTKGGNAKTYVGGLIGYMQSYSDTNTATLTYSYSHAHINGLGEYDLASAGGLVGYLLGTNEEVPAFINTSYFNGEIDGKCYVSGGIVGTMDVNSSVSECYSKGIIKAQSEEKKTSSGAIVGLAKCESAVSNSFSSATLISNNKDTQNYINGEIIGSASRDGDGGIANIKVFELNNYYSTNEVVEISGTSYNLNKIDDVINLLNWNKANWNSDFTINSEGIDNYEISIIFDFGTELTYEGNDGNDLTQTKDTVTSNGAIPLYWVYNGSGKNTFMADNKSISYGYFLDENRTIRIPSSFVISSNMTIYVGFADYSKVVGEYYINLNNIEIKLTFEDNGRLLMQYDGIEASYVFTYDGEKITIYDAYFAQIEYPKLEGVINDELDYFGVKNGDNLVIYDNSYFPIDDGLEINAYIKNNAMGKWYTTNNDVYTFYGNKTGNINGESTFIYECDGFDVTITIGKQKIKATISSDLKEMISEDGNVLSITKFDEFVGEYESDFKLQKVVKFDGKGKVVYNNQEYDYVINDGIALFDKYSAFFNEDKMLVISDGKDEFVFGRKGSFIGTWTDTIIDYWIVFSGITKDGYGYGYDSYGFSFTYILDSEQSGLANFITMYVGTSMYGYGELATGNDGSMMLYLAVYTPNRGMIVDDYNVCYMDSLHGTWHGENGMSITFNGLGGYDIYEYINSLGKYWDVRGFATIKDNNNETDVRYSFDILTNTASFEYLGKTYNVVVDDELLIINDVTYKAPDGLDLYEYELDDKVFTFNGKSSVNLGEVIVTENGTSNTYRYNVSPTNEYIVNIYDNTETIYTLYMDSYKIEDHKNETIHELGLYHKLIGHTYALSNFTTITFDTKFDYLGDATATMVSGENEYELDIMYIDGSYIALYQGDTFLYYAYYLDEKCAAVCDYNFEVISVMATPDKLIGKWLNEDGERVVFDGLSNASSYIYPSCVIAETDEIGTYLESYSYEEVDDHYEITTTENGEVIVKYYVYFEYVEGSVKYTQNDVSIYILKA